MKSPIIQLAGLQFIFYSMFCLGAVVAWVIVLMDYVQTLELILGEYIIGHFMRWTNRFPLWGLAVFISAILSAISSKLLFDMKKSGVVLGAISFLIGFATNMIVASALLVHAAVGLIIGWTLLSPLALGWSKFDE